MVFLLRQQALLGQIRALARVQYDIVSEVQYFLEGSR